jgi:hypothetical protein
MGGLKKRKSDDLGFSGKENALHDKRSRAESGLQDAEPGNDAYEARVEPVPRTTTAESKSQSRTTPERSPDEPRPPQIFRSLNLYVNGSTAPLVSDHRLKQLWVQHGGSVSIRLGRKTVTHVVLGNTGGGGGRLAAGKIQKEISTVRGQGVKYVTAKWVLDSVEKGKRLSEAAYCAADKIGGARQSSVRGLLAATK